jgi:hypothetical protein
MLDSTSPKTPPHLSLFYYEIAIDCSCTPLFKEIDLLFKLEKDSAKKVTHFPRQPAPPFSAIWTARHLYQDKPKSALAALSISTHKKCSKEVSHETIAELNTLSNKNVILALDELKELEKYI